MEDSIVNLLKSNGVQLWTAVAVTVSAIIGFVQLQRDRSKIVLKFYNNKQILNDSRYKEKTRYLHIEVINVGRRSVRISTVLTNSLGEWGQYQLWQDSLRTDITKILTEENPSVSFFLEAEATDYKKIWRINATDQSGKTYSKNLKWYGSFLAVPDRAMRFLANRNPD